MLKANATTNAVSSHNRRKTWGAMCMVRTEVKETAQIPVNTMALRNGIEFSLFSHLL